MWQGWSRQQHTKKAVVYVPLQICDKTAAGISLFMVFCLILLIIFISIDYSWFRQKISKNSKMEYRKPMIAAKIRRYLSPVLQLMIASIALSGAAAAQDKPVMAPGSGEVYERPSEGPEGSPPSTRPAPSRTVRPSAPAQEAADSGKPFQVGSFLFYPELAVTRMYDSNVFYTNRRLGDHAFIFSPSATLQSNWSRHALNFSASSDVTKYDKYQIEDTTDWRVAAEGRYDINPDTNVYGGLRHAKEHQDRESPDFRNGIQPTIYTQDRGYGGFFRQFDRISLRVAGTWQHLNFDDVPFIPGSGIPQMINNDDRDRHQYTGGMRLGYEWSPRLEPYVQVALDNRRYDNTPDDVGFFRNSNGRRFLGGVRWNLPKKLKLDAFAGYMDQNYDDPRLQSVSTPAFGGSLLWAATSKLRVSAQVDRTIEESTLTQTVSNAPLVVRAASSYTNTYASTGAYYRLTNAWSLQGNLSYSEASYNGLDRTDDYYGAGAGVVYRVAKDFYVDLNYGYRNLHSSSPDENFIKRQVFIGLAFPFSH
jgi:hypothetical protein